MKEKGDRPKTGKLPDLKKVIEQAKRLSGSGVGIVVHPDGFNLTIDEAKYNGAKKPEGGPGEDEEPSN